MSLVVLIHGLSEESGVWSRQQPFLEQHAQVVSCDVRGFGDSPVADGQGTVAQFAADLAELIERENAGPAWLVGFSMGGVIAQRLAIDRPELVEGLVLVASSCVVGKPGVAFFNQRIDEVSRDGLAAIQRITQDDASGCFAVDDEELIEEYRVLRTAAVRDPEGYLNACRAMLHLADNPMMGELGEINCPTLVIAGEKDPYCPPRASAMISDAIPGAQLEVIEGAGHCLHWELPQAFNRMILDFIETRTST